MDSTSSTATAVNTLLADALNGGKSNVDLSDQINAEHAACLAAANDALEHAMRAGDLLIQAKAGIEHGEWQKWLSDNFNGAARTARAYMRLAANREVLESQNGMGHAVLTIGEATQLLGESSLNLPPELKAKLAPIALKVRELAKEMRESDRQIRDNLLHMQSLVGDKVFDFAKEHIGMEKSEVRQRLNDTYRNPFLRGVR